MPTRTPSPPSPRGGTGPRGQHGAAGPARAPTKHGGTFLHLRSVPFPSADAAGGASRPLRAPTAAEPRRLLAPCALRGQGGTGGRGGGGNGLSSV